MSAEIESLFYVREKPWHGLGTKVMEAPDSRAALALAGLDWDVVQEPVYTEDQHIIPGYRANRRDTDGTILGIVSDRYKVVQNRDSFAFTDALLGHGVRYETAGSLMGGRRVWILARLPREYIISGEHISPYLVFSNSHDGSGAVKVAVTPVRVVCNNTLNLALNTAERSFSMMHTCNIQEKMEEAKNTLFMAETYMEQLGMEFDRLRTIKITDDQVSDFVEQLLPLDKNPTARQKKNTDHLRDDLMARYYYAPDLDNVGKNAYRFLNAVSDFATHARPIRQTANFKENLFARTVDGNPLIDKAYQLILAA